MRHLFFLFLFLLAFSFVYGQNISLEKRIKTFYKTQENKKLPKDEKIERLKGFIIPGKNNDSMAVFYYNSWTVFNAQAKSLKTKILNIQYSENDSKAIVITEDRVEYLEGDKNTYMNKAVWLKINGVWYRDDKKSQLFKDDQKIR